MDDSPEPMRARVLTVRDLLTSDLRIPDYQRPYRWSARNVGQLLHDIDTYRRFGRYRVGTVIVHRTASGHLDLVDGQQRFLTFRLVAHALAAAGFDSQEVLPELPLPSTGQRATAANLRSNYEHIARSLHGLDLSEWAEFFFENCEVVLLEVDDLDEAFQMFDSQNTRGKALYPTDLLKAFHLREMRADSTTPELRLSMVKLWEDIPPAAIHELFSDYLFKIKRWASGREAAVGGFTTQHIYMFKGIRETELNNAQNFWALPFLYAKNYTDDFRQENATLIRYGALPPVNYPFQIDQPVVNGETFFAMVRHYYDLGLRCGLFRNDRPDSDTERFPELQDTLKVLDEHHRKSTHRIIRNFFDCLVLYYTDRFGEQQLKRAVQLISQVAMAPRVQQPQVRRTTIDKYALGTSNLRFAGEAPPNLFRELREATGPEDFLQRPAPSPALNGYEELWPLFALATDGGVSA